MGSKAKGSAGERIIAKFLTKWSSGQEKEYHFWRSSNSGGLATRTKANAALAGDIVAVVPEAQYFLDAVSVEIKTGYPKATFDDHLKENRSETIEAFWKQCNDAAMFGKKEPMLIFHKTRHPAWVGISNYLAERLEIFTKDIPYITVRWKSEKNLPVMVVYDMELFFENIKPDDIKNFLKFKEI